VLEALYNDSTEVTKQADRPRWGKFGVTSTDAANSRWSPPSVHSLSSAPGVRILPSYFDQKADRLVVLDAAGFCVVSPSYGLEKRWKLEDLPTFIGGAPVLELLGRGICVSAGDAPSNSTSGWLGKLERIVNDLGRLTSDWDGPGSVVPSPKTLVDLETALRCLPSSTGEPEVEADSSDGSLTLTWENIADKHIAATFVGNGRIFLFVSSSEGSHSASASVADDVRIQDLFFDAFSLLQANCPA